MESLTNKIIRMQYYGNKHKTGFNHIYMSVGQVKMCSNDPVYVIDFEIADNQNINELTNSQVWGWLDNDDYFSIIKPNRRDLNMCFPAGLEYTEKLKRGKAYKLEIIKFVLTK
jgi:hypothetical protein